MKTKHTEGKIEAKLNKLTDEKGLCVAVATGPKAHENAERLALAWNCHDELVSALKEFLDYSEGGCNPNLEDVYRAQARAILAKATKGE